MNIFNSWFNMLRSAPLDVNTVGGTNDSHLVHLPHHGNNAVFTNGWYDGATQVAVNKGRMGGKITPRAVVVHTTDTMPGGFNAIVKSWSTTTGLGNAAHFIIGRNAEDGIVQLVPILYNANHAGGKKHGWFVIDGKEVHPNDITVGIELDNAGRLVRVGDNFMHPDTHKYIPNVDVYIDSDGHPWHAITAYQAKALETLLLDLLSVMVLTGILPNTTPIKPNGLYKDNGVRWAATEDSAICGHATLDPYNKTDPGPQVMELLNSWA